MRGKRRLKLNGSSLWLIVPVIPSLWLASAIFANIEGLQAKLEKLMRPILSRHLCYRKHCSLPKVLSSTVLQNETIAFKFTLIQEKIKASQTRSSETSLRCRNLWRTSEECYLQQSLRVFVGFVPQSFIDFSFSSPFPSVYWRIRSSPPPVLAG